MPTIVLLVCLTISMLAIIYYDGMIDISLIGILCALAVIVRLLGRDLPRHNVQGCNEGANDQACAKMPRCLDDLREQLLDKKKTFCHDGGYTLDAASARRVLAQPATWYYENKSAKDIFTFDPDNIHAILTTHADDWHMYRACESSCAILSGPENQTWHKVRQALALNLTMNNVDDDIMIEHIDWLNGLLPEPEDDGGTDISDVFGLLQRYCCDSISDILLSYPLGAQYYGWYARQRIKIMKDWQLWSKPPFLRGPGYCDSSAMDSWYATHISSLKNDSWWQWLLIPLHRMASRALKNIVRLSVIRHVGSRQHNDHLPALDHDDKMAALLLAGLDVDTVATVTSELLTAGLESLAAPLTWLVIELANNTALQAQLRADVFDYIVDGGVEGTEYITWSYLKNCRLLQACILETLRRHPVVASVRRVAKRDTTLPVGGGTDGASPVTVRAGTVLTANIHLMHHWVEAWPTTTYREQPCDAWQFEPLRWLNRQPELSFLPFGVGQRSCPGQEMAIRQMAVAIVALLRVWPQFCSPYGHDNSIQDGRKIATPRNEVKLVVTHAPNLLL